MNNERMKCIILAMELGYEGNIESDYDLMNFLLLLCLKRVLITRWKDYLHTWQRLRQWENGIMTYEDLSNDLLAIRDTDEAYKYVQERRIKGLFKKA